MALPISILALPFLILSVPNFKMALSFSGIEVPVPKTLQVAGRQFVEVRASAQTRGKTVSEAVFPAAKSLKKLEKVLLPEPLEKVKFFGQKTAL